MVTFILGAAVGFIIGAAIGATTMAIANAGSTYSEKRDGE